jgi:RimJ/RimL family protein N-acetyltransferase
MSAHPWEHPSTGAAAALAAGVAARIPELETPRMRLRAPRIEDFSAYAAIATTERGVHIGGPMSRKAAWLDFAQLVAGWTLRGHGVWSVERRADAELLGFVLIGFEPGDREPELGFLFVAEAEGRGYASEAAGAARYFARDALGWDTIVSYVAPENARSIRLAERLGAQREPQMVEGALVFRHDIGEGQR